MSLPRLYITEKEMVEIIRQLPPMTHTGFKFRSGAVWIDPNDDGNMPAIRVLAELRGIDPDPLNHKEGGAE